MLTQKGAITINNIETICDDIVSSHHTPIMAACKSVSAFLQSNFVIKDLSPENNIAKKIQK